MGVKEKPILFSGEMVRAILDGRKTMTRRVTPFSELDVERLDSEWYWYHIRFRDPKRNHGFATGGGGPNGIDAGFAAVVKRFSPYKVGQRLWVRETFRLTAFERYQATVEYAADSTTQKLIPAVLPVTVGLKWRPSIFMPKWASRITLEVTAVRVERLKDISWEDAIKEGFRVDGSEIGVLDKFQSLWDKINGKKHPWASNCWVWVVEFRRIEA